MTIDYNEFNKQIIKEFRENEGRVGGMFEGAPLVLLTTTGAKSGKRVTTPVMYVKDGERYVVIASKGATTPTPRGTTTCAPRPRRRRRSGRRRSR